MDSQATISYLAVMWAKYQGVRKKEKSSIVDDVAQFLGILRKSASRLLRSKEIPRSQWGRRSPKRRRYSPECKPILEALWSGSGFMSSKHLRAALANWLPHFQDDRLTPELREEILRMSERTIESFLKDAKAQRKRKLNTGTRRGVRRLVTSVPIKPLGFKPTEPGHLEADLVAHCGDSMSGTFVWTLTVTDVATGWTECEAIWGKCGKSVCLALREIEKRFPFLILSISFDNGSEFINDDVLKGFINNPSRGRIITVYRSRPYKKNDQSHVEQKNGDAVRSYFGYGRLDWSGTVGMMNALYRGKWRLLQNHYRPQQKLQSKQRIFSKLFRKMDAPETPLSRLQSLISTDDFERLESEGQSANPFNLMTHIRRAIHNIYGYYRGRRRSEEMWGHRVAG